MDTNYKLLTEYLDEVKLSKEFKNTKNYRCDLVLWNDEIYSRETLDGPEFKDKIYYIYLLKTINPWKFKEEYNRNLIHSTCKSFKDEASKVLRNEDFDLF